MANLADRGGPADAYAPLPAKISYLEIICKWVLRLILPMVLGLGGLLFYWVWLDGEHTMVAWRIVGMVPLTVSFGAVAIWALQAWLGPADAERRPARAIDRGVQVRPLRREKLRIVRHD